MRASILGAAAAFTLGIGGAAEAYVVNLSDLDAGGGFDSFALTLEVADDRFDADGRFRYSLFEDAVNSFAAGAPVASDLPGFSLSFGAGGRGPTSFSDAAFASLLGRTLTAADLATLRDRYEVALTVGEGGTLIDASVFASFDGETDFRIGGPAEDLRVSIFSDDSATGCFLPGSCFGRSWRGCCRRSEEKGEEEGAGKAARRGRSSSPGRRW